MLVLEADAVNHPGLRPVLGGDCAQRLDPGRRSGGGGRLHLVIDVLYARADDGTHVAYRVLEEDPSAGPVRDIVMLSVGLIPLELFEEEPGFARLLDGLRSLGRVLLF